MSCRAFPKAEFAEVAQLVASGFDIGPPPSNARRMHEVSGTIKVIFAEQSFPSGFTKREFVVTTAAERYPQDLKFELVKDKCNLINSFSEGQEVTVSFDIRGNEYNGKYFVNLSAWKIQSGGHAASPAAESAKSNTAEPTAADLRDNDNFDDDIAPF